jgi:hypothetical protein
VEESGRVPPPPELADGSEHPETRTFGELLIDLEEDWVLRAVLVGMLRAAER